jgi:SAM-dependent methyltransferase
MTVRRLESAARLFGVDVRRGARSVAATPRLFAERKEFLRQAAGAGETFPLGRLWPCFDDAVDDAGTAAGAYFHQDLYVAQRIFAKSPRKHLDVGSRVDGFVAHVASFREIEVVDIRPLRTSASGITFLQRDVMERDALPENYADSVSCLHALEHFGLGRYGDKIDFQGHRRGFENLVRTCEPGGTIYLSVPMGPLRVEFNAHRIFSTQYILDMGRSCGVLAEAFSYVDDAGELHPQVGIDPDLVATNYGCYGGTGLFEFKKPAG